MDPLITCPYDKSHRIIRSRVQSHLVNCRKNFPLSDKKTCPFNTTHVVPEIEFDYHLENCNDSNKFNTFIDKSEPPLPEDNVVSVEKLNEASVSSSENWDEELTVPSYDPLRNIQDRAVYVSPVALSKAQKKRFKEAERKRFLNAAEK